MTRLIAPARTTKLRNGSVLLGDAGWSPINSQNTALHRDAIVTYYFVRMGYPLAGMPIDRYGDIVSGYFSARRACERWAKGFASAGRLPTIGEILTIT